MARITKPNLTGLLAYETDTTDATYVYTRYSGAGRNQYVERQSKASPHTLEWTQCKWTDRATVTNWASINERYIDF